MTTRNQWFDQFGPKPSPFLTGLYVCFLASASWGFCAALSVGLPLWGTVQTLMSTWGAASYRAASSSGERL